MSTEGHSPAENNASGTNNQQNTDQGIHPNLMHMAEGNDRLMSMYQELLGCHKCALGDTRTHIVPGVGNPHAKVMFIGEAPGRNEDLKGEPFVGAAGNLLNQMLERAGLKREDIYIANILKCRPPGNRDPRPEEIEVCTPWLREQVRAVRPQVLVTLGNFSTKFILQTTTGITRLRGKVHVTGPFRVIPMFHPAAAIYDRSKITVLEQDFDLLKLLLETDEQRAKEAAENKENS